MIALAALAGIKVSPAEHNLPVEKHLAQLSARRRKTCVRRTCRRRRLLLKENTLLTGLKWDAAGFVSRSAAGVFPVGLQQEALRDPASAEDIKHPAALQCHLIKV